MVALYFSRSRRPTIAMTLGFIAVSGVAAAGGATGGAVAVALAGGTLAADEHADRTTAMATDVRLTMLIDFARMTLLAPVDGMDGKVRRTFG
jgi:hypothetical protein